MKPIKVLVVDDSAFMRRVIGDIIRSHESLDLVATARDGFDALKKIKDQRPDVVTMDLEMPRLDGITTVRRIMSEYPIPIIMLSSHTRAGSESTLKALDAGAVDFIAKPSISSAEGAVDELKNVLPEKIIAAASAQVSLIEVEEPPDAEPGEAKPPASSFQRESSKLIVAIGASTGGPKALEDVFKRLPPDLPASALLSQHMPPGFTLSFSERLNLLSPLNVKEAENGDPLLNGQALVAPGGYHIIVKNNRIVLDSGPKVNFVRPAIDVMLKSLAECKQKVLVVIMTGMGKDGAEGAQYLKNKKKDTLFIAQDPSTSLISSMPEALIKSGVCDVVAPLNRLASEIEKYIRVLV